jgi:hypothetical protein
MAGSNPDFNADEFRDGIKFAMQMGAPVDTANQVTFYFETPGISASPSDSTGTPFDPAASDSAPTTTSVTVDCAVSFTPMAGDHERMGYVVGTMIDVLLLDNEYELVTGCDWCLYGGDRYDFRYEHPPMGLFDAGVHTLRFVARGER